ncbi:MAG: hypothetical protein R3Y24_08750 [Eubacteriales bacterium]
MAKKKMKYEPKSKAYLRGILFLVCMISVMGFVLMSVFMLKYENGAHVMWSYLGVFSCIAMQIIALVVIGIHANYFMMEEERKLNLAYENHSVQCIEACNKIVIQEGLAANGFEKKRKETYEKTKFIFWRAITMSCFAKWVTMQEDADLEDAISRESAFYYRKQKIHHSCCLLFMEKSNFTQEELTLLKERAKRQILMDNMRLGPPPRSVLTVLVDTTQNKGYYLKTLSPRDASAYAYSCKLIEAIIPTLKI